MPAARAGWCAALGLAVALAAAGCLKPEGGGAQTRPAAGQAAATRQKPRVVGWRGDGTGRHPEASPPATWDVDEKKNIIWTAEVGSSFSSPVVAGDRIFLTSEEDLLLCVAGKDGKLLWRKPNGFKQLPPELRAGQKQRPSDCGFSTPTPVTDGQHVYAAFGTGIVACYDLEGRRQWVRYLDLPPSTEYGRSASPVLAGGRLLVSIGHLIALDPATGKTLWGAKKALASYGTPAVATVGGVDVVITPNGDCVRLADGQLLAAGVASSDYGSPTVHDGVVYFVGEPTVAVKLSAKAGAGLAATKLWEADEMEGEFFASPVVHEGRVYCASNEGVLYALDARTGKVAWRKQLGIPSAGGLPGVEPANIYASIALAGGRLYLGNDAGYMLVLIPGGEYKEVSENTIDEGSGASPAFDGSRLYLRGGELLYCIGPK